MVLKARNIPFLVMLLVSLYPGIERFLPKEESRELEWTDSLLPAAARDVLVVTADFSACPEDVLDRNGISMVAEIDAYLADMTGLRRYSSLLTASVIRAEQDEILVVPFIPDGLLQSYDSQTVEELKAQYADFPEIRPYLSPDFQTCVFYLEPGLAYSSHALIRQIEELQSRIKIRYDIPLEFTGLRAIRVYNERLLTQDMLKMLPVVFLLISLIYFLFLHSWRVLLAAWSLKILATTFAFGCFRLFGGQVSPFVILVPIFNFGLLSDYFLHMFYHLRRFGGTDARERVRQYLTVPLSLTALTSVIGFASLTLLGGEGHILLAATVGTSILVVYFLVLWWIPSSPALCSTESLQKKPPMRSLTRRVHRGLTVIFLAVFKARHVFLTLCVAAGALGILALPRLKVQPYPLEQFQDSLTIIKAESLLNEKFSGTVPFTLEIDSGQAGSFITKTGLGLLDEAQRILGANADVGYQNSILTVLKRMHYYFNDADPRYLAIPEIDDEDLFSALVEQYLLFYSASASPEAYESLIDSAQRIASVQGILKYRGTRSLTDFQSSLVEVRNHLPPNWRIALTGPLNELVVRKKQLERNWFFAVAFGSLLIFLTVLIFFRSLKMSLISMLPSLFILLVVTGICLALGIQIDEYTVIVVAVSTGLTIDYTIHLLNSIRDVRKGYSAGSPPSMRRDRILRFGYSLIRSGGLPVFLSFLTSVVAFSSLYLSSFSGAAHFGLLISAAISIAFFIGVFLLPLLFIPGRGMSTKSNA